MSLLKDVAVEASETCTRLQISHQINMNDRTVRNILKRNVVKYRKPKLFFKRTTLDGWNFVKQSWKII